jgi:hypothetical protein
VLIAVAIFVVSFGLQLWVFDNEDPALLAAIPAVVIGAGWWTRNRHRGGAPRADRD